MFAVLLWLWGCRPEAAIVDACDDGASRDTGWVCHPCDRDEDCVITGNPCSDVATCAHVDDVVPSIDLACNRPLERRWPDDTTCACLADGYCSYVP